MLTNLSFGACGYGAGDNDGGVVFGSRGEDFVLVRRLK